MLNESVSTFPLQANQLSVKQRTSLFVVYIEFVELIWALITLVHFSHLKQSIPSIQFPDLSGRPNYCISNLG